MSSLKPGVVREREAASLEGSSRASAEIEYGVMCAVLLIVLCCYALQPPDTRGGDITRQTTHQEIVNQQLSVN